MSYVVHGRTGPTQPWQPLDAPKPDYFAAHHAAVTIWLTERRTDHPHYETAIFAVTP